MSEGGSGVEMEIGRMAGRSMRAYRDHEVLHTESIPGCERCERKAEWDVAMAEREGAGGRYAVRWLYWRRLWGALRGRSP
jgi:hypothetical protein